MDHSGKAELTNEYVKIFKGYLKILKLGAFNRFDIKNSEVVSITRCSQLWSIIVMIAVLATSYIILLETSIKKNILILPEYITVIELAVLNNVVLLNIYIFNRHSGSKLLNHCIDIDLFLGIRETKFMRDIVIKDVIIWSGMIATFEAVIALILIIAFNDKIPVYLYFVCILYFQLLFTLCYDQVVHVCLYKFLCLRVHYLNVGLMKIANLNTEYLIDRMLSYPFNWRIEYDNNVDLSRKNTKHFTKTLRMVDAQVRRVQDSYRFMIFVSMTSLVIGTFLAVQTIILFIKDPDIPLIRTFSLMGWFFASWSIFIGITQQTDKLGVQIQRTKIICTYIQLKPSNPEELFNLSRSILDTVATCDCRISIYDLFYFNQSILRSIATSVFVYITMQLQFAFPKRSSTHGINII